MHLDLPTSSFPKAQVTTYAKMVQNLKFWAGKLEVKPFMAKKQDILGKI